MSEFEDLMKNYESLLIERNGLAEFSDAATEKIEQLELYIETREVYIEQLERQLSMQQSSSCEE